jgi:hypothetical protein
MPHAMVNLFLRGTRSRELHRNQTVFNTISTQQKVMAMKAGSVWASAVALVVAGSISVALAQTPAPGPSKPDQNAKQEPSSKNTGSTSGNADVLANGALAVPGAPTDTATVPAKFSKKNDADDHLLLLSYAFKHLTADQRSAIYRSVAAKPTTAKVTDANPQIGDALPVTLDVAPLPPDAVAQAPDLEKYGYAMSGDKLLVINPVNMVVVDVITASKS